jgi:hypothetical protein
MADVKRLVGDNAGTYAALDNENTALKAQVDELNTSLVALETERDQLRAALELYEATAADEMMYSFDFQRCHEQARAALAGKEQKEPE